MVVIVNWVHPKSRDRFGQVIRYFSKLKISSLITVSIKPSAIKLPPKSTPPLIMVGQGTDLTPFRAFIQHRVMEKPKTKKSAPFSVTWALNTSAKSTAMAKNGMLTKTPESLGPSAALSLEISPQQFYIQDRMRQTVADIVRAYITEEGAFYLCRLTWPVPEVMNVLEEVIATDAKAKGAKKKY